MHIVVPQDFFLEEEHKKVHIFENFESYSMFEVYALLLLLFQPKFG